MLPRDSFDASVDGKNTISISYTYKKTTDANYPSYTALQDNVLSTFTADNNYEWNVRIKITDSFGTTYYNLILQRGMPILFIDKDKSSVGFNCFPKYEKSVEINGENISYDSGWIDFELPAGVTARVAKYRRIGREVDVVIQNLAGWTFSTTFATIPTGFKPSVVSANAFRFIVPTSGTNYARLEIVNGAMHILNSTSSEGNWIDFQTTFFTDDDIPT